MYSPSTNHTACTPREYRPDASKWEMSLGASGLPMSKRSKPAGLVFTALVWYATAMTSPTTSSELDRTLACGSSVCTTTLGFFGSVTSTAVKFFGADSCASQRILRPSRASCIPMPSPMPPKPCSSWCERSFMLRASVWSGRGFIPGSGWAIFEVLVRGESKGVMVPPGRSIGGGVRIRHESTADPGRCPACCIRGAGAGRLPGKTHPLRRSVRFRRLGGCADADPHAAALRADGRGVRSGEQARGVVRAGDDGHREGGAGRVHAGLREHRVAGGQPHAAARAAVRRGEGPHAGVELRAGVQHARGEQRPAGAHGGGAHRLREEEPGKALQRLVGGT